MFLYDKTNILEGSGIFEVDFAPSHGPAISTVILTRVAAGFEAFFSGDCPQREQQEE